MLTQEDRVHCRDIRERLFSEQRNDRVPAPPQEAMLK